MAATMVIDPRPDGWEIINADDFSNPESNSPVASFIEKIDGIPSQKTLDDAAKAIGASDWVTVDDLDDDILESRKSASSPFDVESDEYEPYSSDKVFHTNTTHQSHVDGILDSINGAIASTRKSDERRSPKNMYTMYDEDVDVDSQSNDFYGSISYGDPNDIGDFVLMTAYGPDGADGHMECSVRSNNEVINQFDASSWEDAKEQFRVQSEVDGMYDDDVFQHVDYPVDLGVDYLNPYSFRNFANKRSINQSEVRNMNKKKAYNQEFSMWGEDIIENTANQFSASLNYGEDGDENNSVTLYADGDNGMEGPMECTVVENEFGGNIDEFEAESWDDAKDQFDTQSNLNGAYNSYLVTQEDEFNSLNGVGASRKRASVENSNGHVFDDSDWDAIVQNMDPDIREQLSENLAPCSNQEFFDAYADAYYEKYGEEWELDKADPQW